MHFLDADYLCEEHLTITITIIINNNYYNYISYSLIKKYTQINHHSTYNNNNDDYNNKD